MTDQTPKLKLIAGRTYLLQDGDIFKIEGFPSDESFKFDEWDEPTADGIRIGSDGKALASWAYLSDIILEIVYDLHRPRAPKK